MMILWFLFGALCGGVLATTVMAMLFIAKKADESEVTASSYFPPEPAAQELCTADR